MIKVVITNELKPYEADIRDLCMAFFPYQKVYVEDNHIDSDELCEQKTCSVQEPCKSKNYKRDDSEPVVIRDFFVGELTGNRIIDKSEIKRQLYNYLNTKTNKKLLWGTLTGIRPVTIVTNKIENYASSIDDTQSEKKITNVLGLSPITEIDNKIYKLNERVKKELVDEYYISDEKAYQIIEIANREIKILARDKVKDYRDRYSIYIGVPFCKSTCLYCSFTSYNVDKYKDYVSEYLNKLEKELACSERARSARPYEYDGRVQKWEPMSVYIGGGTPTSLNTKDFERLLNIVDEHINMNSCVEYTIEAGRPDTIDEDKLKLMRDHKVSRISINPQTFNQRTLDLIGRKHTVKDIILKFNLARKLGFDNINMDIILGLPDEKIYNVLVTLFNLYKLKPDSLTIHSLALKRAARLNNEIDFWAKDHYLAGLSDSKSTEGKRTIDKMYAYSKKLTEILKMKPYYLYRQKNMAGNLENIGYANEGKECIYNIMMMSERHTVYGFGTATTKKVFYEKDRKRIENELGYKSVIDYCKSEKM